MMILAMGIMDGMYDVNEVFLFIKEKVDNERRKK